MYYAHSSKDGVSRQLYAAHVYGVAERAAAHAATVSPFSEHDGDFLRSVVKYAALYHDLGKLDCENQVVLSDQKKAKRLPVNHVDAGTAALLDNEQVAAQFAGVLVSAHHAGLPDFIHESNRINEAFRDANIAKKIDTTLPEYMKIHNALVSPDSYSIDGQALYGDTTIFWRMALSCIADADHTDTAVHYHKYPDNETVVPLRATERLKQLDAFVDGLARNSENAKKDGERTRLRSEMYTACRDADIISNISACNSPVGSGKTTAVMAHLLKQAVRRGLRRIFIILPYTNIITQSVKIYREALTLSGESTSDVVAELHHRADFESIDTRHLTALWRAPIIVTTAVAFFETLANNTPAALRRLHELPGSAIFVDEAHAALPPPLLPLAWRWMNVYANEWKCYWVLASGSLCRFWDIEEIACDHVANAVPEIVSNDFRRRLSSYEKRRVTYKYDPEQKSTAALAEWIVGSEGPRLVILNTVQNAAVLADHMKKHLGVEHVEHLSAALLAADREATLKCITERLRKPDDRDWTLVATSCVEAGVDLSFRTGFRELAALISLLQTGGRVDREWLYKNSVVWSFSLAPSIVTNENPGFKYSKEILRAYFQKEIDIEPALCTKAIREEIRMNEMPDKLKSLLNDEKNERFPSVERGFKVINNDYRIAVVDPALAGRIKYGHVDWREIQSNSVQIAKHKLVEMRTPEIADGIYHWNHGYDAFLGYMSGIVPLKKLEAGDVCI